QRIRQWAFWGGKPRQGNLNMRRILIILLLNLSVAQAHQKLVQTQQSATYLHDAAAKGDKAALQQLITRAERGEREAQAVLGFLYVEGDGVAQDLSQAVRWWRRAADQGDAAVGFNLGFLYFKGELVPKDSAEALRWFGKAAELGDANAQFHLGWMYREGD